MKIPNHNNVAADDDPYLLFVNNFLYSLLCSEVELRYCRWSTSRSYISTPEFSHLNYAVQIYLNKC